MTSWQELLKNSITSPDELAVQLDCPVEEIAAVAAKYPLRINSYYLNLIKKHGLPLYRQAVPDKRELTDVTGMVDPLAEEDLSPVPGLVHKYPDRVLLLVNHECAMYCRFCTRKRIVGNTRMCASNDQLQQAFSYLRATPQVREVLVSGGDPLLLSDERLEWILTSLRAIPNIDIIRIGSRAPCTLPMRITSKLCAVLQQFHPLYINTHFNHPAEVTAEAAQACTMLANAGIPLGCQTVLLRGVNDDADTLAQLFRQLLSIRVKPYYLFQADLTRGTDHFRTRIEDGLAIMRQLIGQVSGMAVPTFALDAPGGGGKIPLTPNYIRRYGEVLEFVNYLGNACWYPNSVCQDSFASQSKTQPSKNASQENASLSRGSI
jgi:lysine 2,3-aminomutase